MPDIHNNYLKLTPEETQMVDSIYRDATERMRSEGHKIRGDDRAERLIEALSTYLIDSRK
jgi:hypothetical protein